MRYEELSSHSYFRREEQRGELPKIRGVAAARRDTRVGSCAQLLAQVVLAKRQEQKRWGPPPEHN